VQRPGEAPNLRLPTNRAFVVQLADGGPGGELLRGRAEHLDSGQVTIFASLDELGAFIEGVLGGVGAGDLAGEDPT
jgi:hypothetical protein